jgi:hypothetical protein
VDDEIPRNYPQSGGIEEHHHDLPGIRTNTFLRTIHVLWVAFNRYIQKCSLSDPHRALVTWCFLGILFILSFCHRECFLLNDISNLKSKNSLFFAALKLNSWILFLLFVVFVFSVVVAY